MALSKWFSHLPKRVSNRVVFGFVLILLPFLYFYSAVIGGVALVQGDGWTANIGLRILTGQMLRQGVMPLWNPFIFAGMPLLATIYPGVLYPPNWVFAFLPAGAAMNLLVITTYHIAIIGAYRYARILEINRIGALITGIIFGFGGYMVMSLGQTSNIAAAAWLPWVLLAIEKLYKRISWRWVALGALIICLQFFAGVPQITWYTALVGGAYFLFTVILREKRESRWKFAIAVLAMTLCAAALCAVQLLTLRELQLYSGREVISYEYFSDFSFPPKQLLALMIPYFFGGAALPPYRVAYWGNSGIFITCGYVGALGLLLALIALISSRYNSIVRFWVVSAAVSLLLSFGHYLPFNLYKIFYQIPVYNLFRASFRHMYEFTFAIAVLAGFGLSWLTTRRELDKSRVLHISITTFAVVTVAAIATYRFALTTLAGSGVLPHQCHSLTNPEILIPVIFIALSLATVWYCTKTTSRVPSLFLVMVLLLDLACYGQFLEWRLYTFDIGERLKDPPSVQYIKEREHNLNSFRILSYAGIPFGNEYEKINYPNLSIARGLQSVNGYDMLQMRRSAAIAGEMTTEGLVRNLAALGAYDQSFNLLNVKYLLYERGRKPGETDGVHYEGVRFGVQPLEIRLVAGASQELIAGGAAADELVVVSSMSNSAHLPDGSPTAKIRLHTLNKKLIECELLAGRDTSEWAWDRADVKPVAKHRRARVVESWEAGGFLGHRYLARVHFERAEIERLELVAVRPDAEVLITRASLYNSNDKVSTPLDESNLPSERWRKLSNFGPIDLYENLKVMPRAWFVNKLAALPSTEVLRTITNGKLPDGEIFNPAEVALLETEDFEKQASRLSAIEKDSSASVELLRYEPQRIEVKTRNTKKGFLVLSEIYFPGWEASIDEERVELIRTNYALRGLPVPAGEHRIEFVFRSASFRRGATISILGAMLLLLWPSAVFLRRRALNRNRQH